ncbi:hypothetical protein PTSG_07446 [Salpingoeca rosetta]|uniref:Hint domain-containing protein n=1 Tax=Salpingoeca rosetta (strain ATCC 50818 / BSB-021) TaxID=946362 RepID=F2UIR3_SALR5|nr:uncharacterized protein PTSG_07446 [Salpingoeca rosetta]EGD77112.1 hypothetical protein PTSG_07446 [Salpingoeca rosetta]|eukprot:XP_004990951.1 hypothetical protein PTSG_07446 [Salpingoeca rosetta]
MPRAFLTKVWASSTFYIDYSEGIQFVIDGGAPVGTEIKCVGVSDEPSNPHASALSNTTEFWALDISSDINYFALLADATGETQTLQSGSLFDNFTHGCSARLKGSGADCPVVLSDPTTTSPSCFPGWAEVILENGERVQLRDLKTGDRVLCLQASAGNALGYCELKTFQHVELNGTTTSVELHYTDNDGNPALMSATPDHFVFRADEDVCVADGVTVQPAGEFIFTGEFAVGDRMLRYDADLGVMYTVNITSISYAIEPDYFTPLTDDGSTLFVEDVFASSFALLESPDALRLGTAPIWQNADDRFTVLYRDVGSVSNVM